MTSSPDPFIRAAPPVFVLLWSTGWIVAGLAAHDADPLTFLFWRYVLSGAVLAGIALAARAPWPHEPATIGHAMMSGVLLHALYLGGLWWAVAHGVPSGVSALIAALQPILTAMLAPVLIGERITGRQWLGVLVGLAGITLVILPRLLSAASADFARIAVPLAVNIAAMFAVTFGTFYQKRFVKGGDLRVVTLLQYAAAALVTLPVAWAIEPMRMDWTHSLVLTMGWSVLAISIGAVWLLLILIRRGAVAKAAALIYLVPPVGALLAYLFFGETLSPVQIGGMAATAFGVMLARQAAA